MENDLCCCFLCHVVFVSLMLDPPEVSLNMISRAVACMSRRRKASASEDFGELGFLRDRNKQNVTAYVPHPSSSLMCPLGTSLSIDLEIY